MSYVIDATEQQWQTLLSAYRLTVQQASESKDMPETVVTQLTEILQVLEAGVPLDDYGIGSIKIDARDPEMRGELVAVLLEGLEEDATEAEAEAERLRQLEAMLRKDLLR